MKNLRIIYQITFLAILFLANKTFAQVGQLDVNFNNTGVAGIDHISDWDEGYAIVLQTDGKVVLGGRTTNNNTNTSDLLVARLNADGTVDSSFAGDGKAIINISSQENIMAVKIQPDGKILAAGYYIENDGHYAVVRLNDDGSFDNSFGNNGVDTFSYFEGTLKTMALQSDGKILLGGSDYTNTNKHSHLMRLNSNGSIDSTFGVNGRIIYALGLSQEDDISEMTLQANGKILACGTYRDSNLDALFLMRLNTNGSIDSSFSSDGISIFSSNTDFRGYCLALQNDGKIVVAGEGNSGTTDDFLVGRFNADGNIDSSFAAVGFKLLPVSTQEDEVRGVKIDSDLKIVLVGTSRMPDNYMNVSLVRLNSDGSLDNTFGIVTSNLNGIYGGESWAAAIQPDDKILTVGKYYGSNSMDIAVGRFIGACQAIDNTVTGTGSTLTANQNSANYQWLNCDSTFAKIIGANSNAFTAVTTGNYAVQINLNGCLDTSACQTVTSAVGIQTVFANAIQVSPNPFTDKISIDFGTQGLDNDATVEVYNSIGQLVAREKIFSTTHVLQLRSCTSGFYLLRITSNGVSFEKKLIKNRGLINDNW